MTNKEHLIKLLCEKLPGVTADTVTKVFDIIRERDWAVFCSFMADDRDHPEERVAANEAMTKKLEEFVACNITLREAVDTILKELENKRGTIGHFYQIEFHSLGKEYIS